MTRRTAVIAVSALAAIVFYAACIIIACAPAHARWKPEYAELSPEVRRWYATRELTDAAFKRFGFHSCCENSDVVDTKFRVLPNGDDAWEYLAADKTWKLVPSDIIHWGEVTPDGQPVMFAIDGAVPTCFYPGQSLQ